MANLDPKLTREMQDWLNARPADRDFMRGAAMLRSLNRNKALYNTLVRNPGKYMSKLEYELRKHLRIRLHNMSVADVVHMEAEVMPRVASTVATPPTISSDDELPEAHTARGRRADHDSLPPEIQALWDGNATRYRKIVLLFNELKAMADQEPCDRFEKLQMLDELDKQYRHALEQYDGYLPGHSALPPSATPPLSAVRTDEEARRLSAARKTLGKYKKVASTADVSDDRRTLAITKCRACVAVIRDLGGKFTPEVAAELSALGIDVTDKSEA